MRSAPAFLRAILAGVFLGCGGAGLRRGGAGPRPGAPGDRRSSTVRLVLAFLAVIGAGRALAEPAIAVRTGYRCSQCHVNNTGGGMRTPFGSLYAQTVLPQSLPRWREEGNLLPADPDARFAVGVDVRFQALRVASPDGPDTFSFEVPEANVYGEGRLVPGRLSIYLDASAGPGGSSARELFALMSSRKLQSYVKIGKFLPPYGWRLPDDQAFIRRFTGFAYSAPDIGVEAGIEPGPWSLHLAVVNGASGGSEENRSKQVSLLAARRFGKWRLGVSGSNNIAGGGRASQAGVMAAWRLGHIVLLGEGDWRADRMTDRTRRRLMGFLETDFQVWRGMNVKVAHDWIDPDRSVRTDARARDSVGLEWVPFPFLQLRLFGRRSDGPPQVQGSRDRQLELEAHVFF